MRGGYDSRYPGQGHARSQPPYYVYCSEKRRKKTGNLCSNASDDEHGSCRPYRDMPTVFVTWSSISIWHENSLMQELASTNVCLVSRIHTPGSLSSVVFPAAFRQGKSQMEKNKTWKNNISHRGKDLPSPSSPEVLDPIACSSSCPDS